MKNLIKDLNYSMLRLILWFLVTAIDWFITFKLQYVKIDTTSQETLDKLDELYLNYSMLRLIL